MSDEKARDAEIGGVVAGSAEVDEEERALREAQGAVVEMSNQKRREARSIVNRMVHSYPGGEEKIFDDISSGVSIMEIARRLEVSEGAFYAWTETTPKRSGEFTRARARAAHALAEQGLSIVDSADVVSANLANVRARYRQWLASKWNQQAYGEQKQQIAVQVNMNQAHLMASRVVDHVHAVNDENNTVDAAPHNG